MENSKNDFTIINIEAFNDNYIFYIECNRTGKNAIVDPGDPYPVIDFLKTQNKKLDQILITHHHRDHVGGIIALKEIYSCTISGSKKDAARIPGIDILLQEGEEVHVGNLNFQVLALDGHTIGHIGYHDADSKILFCGDTVFSLGCGKLFEGTPEQMWSSLDKIRKLPKETLIYCTHEYTLENGLFASQLEPSNVALASYLAECETKRAEGNHTIPTRLSVELNCNPFFRIEIAHICNSLDMQKLSLAERFGKMRQTKDLFDSGNYQFTKH